MQQKDLKYIEGNAEYNNYMENVRKYKMREVADFYRFMDASKDDFEKTLYHIFECADGESIMIAPPNNGWTEKLYDAVLQLAGSHSSVTFKGAVQFLFSQTKDAAEEDEVEEEEEEATEQKKVMECKFYNTPVGCRKGANCKFLHINESEECEEATEQKVECKFYNTPRGCKFGTKCLYAHIKRVNSTKRSGRRYIHVKRGRTQ